MAFRLNAVSLVKAGSAGRHTRRHAPGDAVLFATTLLAIVNPLSSAVLFAAMAGRFAPGIQRNMANQSAFAVLVILLVCAWIGRPLLQVLGISVPMLQAAGGLILLLLRNPHGHGRGAEADTRRAGDGRRGSGGALESARGRTARDSRHRRRRRHHHRRHPGDDVFQSQGFGEHLGRLRGNGGRNVADLPVRRTDRPAIGPIGLNIVTRVMGILVSATAFGLLGRGIGGLLPGLAR